MHRTRLAALTLLLGIAALSLAGAIEPTVAAEAVERSSSLEVAESYRTVPAVANTPGFRANHAPGSSDTPQGETVLPEGALGSGGSAGTDGRAQRVVLSGWLTVIWRDPEPGSGAEPSEIYVLIDDTGRSTRLLMDPGMVQSMGGILALNRARVELEGDVIGRGVVQVQSAQFAPGPGLDAAGSPSAWPPAIGAQPWITILCKFADVPEEPQPLTYYQEMYSSMYPGLDHFWRELSYDRMDLTGSGAVGWYTLPQPQSYYFPIADIDHERALNDCTAAADADVYFPDYYGINMMFNWGTAWGGGWWLELDGVARWYGVTWIGADTDLSTVEHEMGHGFGLPHSADAEGWAYMNFWDVMRGHYCELGPHPVYGCLGPHAISYHKDTLGWIAPAEKYMATAASRSISLERLALPQKPGYRMVQIPVDGSTSRFYTVEARPRIGYDVDTPLGGVVIHEVDTTRPEPAHLAQGMDWPTLDVGETFANGEDGLWVFVSAKTATAYSVTIGHGSPPAAPAVPLNVSASDGTYTDRVRVTWDASSAATFYHVYRTGGLGRGPLDSTSATSYDDFSASEPDPWPGDYYYWVKACKTEACSDDSKPDIGYRTVGSFEKTADVLLVPDNGGYRTRHFLSYFVDALDDLGVPYDLWDTAARGALDNTVLSLYVDGATIWGVPSSGYLTDSSASAQADLQTYLDTGGRLFVTGQDIGVDAGATDFYRDYLHAQYVQDDTELFGAAGGGGDPIGDRLALTIYPSDNARYFQRPSEIDPLGPAVAVFSYGQAGADSLARATTREPQNRVWRSLPVGSRDGVTGSDAWGAQTEKAARPSGVISSGTAGLRVDTGTYRVVYFPFGFEAINGAADRAAVMARVLAWLGVDVGSATITIVKNTVPDHVFNFSFTGHLGSFTLDDPATDDGDGYGKSATFNVPPGRYTVHEDDFAPRGWLLGSIKCDWPERSTVDLGNRQVTIDARVGESVRCSFVNRPAARIHVRKYEDLNGNGGRNAVDPWLIGWRMNLYDDLGSLLLGRKTKDIGSVPRAIFKGLMPDDYIVCETLGAGWANTQPGALHPTINLPCYDLSLNWGQLAVVRFGNMQAPTMGSMPTVAGPSDAQGVWLFDLPADLLDLPDELQDEALGKFVDEMMLQIEAEEEERTYAYPLYLPLLK